MSGLRQGNWGAVSTTHIHGTLHPAPLPDAARPLRQVFPKRLLVHAYAGSSAGKIETRRLAEAPA
jgi:hypothetical protein